MLKKYSFLFLIVIVFVTCKKELNSEADHLIMIDPTHLEEVLLSEFVEEVKVIPLEIHDDFLIGNIWKIQLFEDKIYILDQLTNSLYIYNDNGKILNVLNKTGGGPGEYVNLMDFEVNSKGIFVLDVASHRILQYDSELTYQHKTQFPLIGSRFLVDENYFWIFNEPIPAEKDFQLSYIHAAGKELASFFPRKTNSNFTNWAGSNVLQRYKDTIYFSPRYGNTIYKYTGDKWQENIRLFFGNKTFPEEEEVTDYNIYSEDFPYILRNNFHITDKYVVIDFYVNTYPYFSFYNKQTHQVKTGRVNNDLIKDYNRFFPRWASENTLIEAVQAAWVLDEFKGLMNIEPSLKELTEDDNPVLVLYRLKDK